MVAVLGFVGNGLEGLGISLLIPLLGDLVSSTPTKLPGPLASLAGFAATLTPELRLYAIAAIIFAAAVLKAVVMTANATLVAWIDGQAGHAIRCALSRRLLHVGYAFYLGEEPARLVTILGTEAWRASDAVRTIFSMVAAASAVAVFGLILLVIESRLSLAVFAGVLVIRIVQTQLVRRLSAMSARVSDANRRLSMRMLLGVDAPRLIRIFGQEMREEMRFREASEEVRRAMFRVDATSAPLGPVLDVMHAALFIAVLLGAYQAGVTVPVIVAFLVLLYRMQPHLRALSQGRLQLAAARGPVAEVEWLLDPRNKPPAPVGTAPFKRLTQAIVFEHVRFSYPNRQKAGMVLSDVSFRMGANRAIALIGRSGAGKTTVVNLLCRLIEPTSGRITVDGIDLADIDPQSWLDSIGLAGQDIELIDGTVAENIAYGRPEATIDEITEVARLADADAFIRMLPDGYATRVGSRGLSLSGGQRQRIGISRALLRKPQLLILDEAMSAVDAISESAVVSLLDGRLRGTTVIVISHRASTLAYCQDGIVLDQGKIVEAGPLTALAAYRQLMSAPIDAGA